MIQVAWVRRFIRFRRCYHILEQWMMLNGNMFHITEIELCHHKLRFFSVDFYGVKEKLVKLVSSWLYHIYLFRWAFHCKPRNLSRLSYMQNPIQCKWLSLPATFTYVLFRFGIPILHNNFIWAFECVSHDERRNASPISAIISNRMRNKSLLASESTIRLRKCASTGFHLRGTIFFCSTPCLLLSKW